MMKLQDIINRVSNFSIYDRERIYVTKDFDLFLNNKKVAFGIDLDNYDLYKNNTIICIKNDDTIVGDLLISNKQYLKSSINYNSNTLILSGDFVLEYPKYSSVYYLFNLLDNSYKEVIRFESLKFILNTDDNLFLSNADFITCCNYSCKEPIWQFPLLSIPNNPHNDNYNKEADWEVKKLIGVLEGKLWIALNHHTIVALDIVTGVLVHQIHTIANFHCSWLPSAIPLPEATQIDETTHKLIGFMWEFYWEINPTNGAIQLYDLTNEFSKKKIRNDIANFVLTDSKIYFASHFDSKIGALYKVTKKLTWEYEFQKEEGAEPRIMELQGNENLLGALSSQGTLYIFEREENA